MLMILLALALCSGVMFGFAGKALGFTWMYGSVLGFTDNYKDYEARNGFDNFSGTIYGITEIKPMTSDAAVGELGVRPVLYEGYSYYGPWSVYELAPKFVTNTSIVSKTAPHDSYHGITPNNWYFYYNQGIVSVSTNGLHYYYPPESPITLAD